MPMQLGKCIFRALLFWGALTQHHDVTRVCARVCTGQRKVCAAKGGRKPSRRAESSEERLVICQLFWEHGCFFSSFSISPVSFFFLIFILLYVPVMERTSQRRLLKCGRHAGRRLQLWRKRSWTSIPSLTRRPMFHRHQRWNGGNRVNMTLNCVILKDGFKFSSLKSQLGLNFHTHVLSGNVCMFSCLF